MDPDLIRRLSIPGESKVLLCVLDGLGGLPGPLGRSELESADCRHLDRLATEGALGQTIPVGHGITPGSGPGHLALFGYDPLVYEVGRGVLEGTGIDIALQPSDLAARGNLCTVDAGGNISDRRAGRVATEVTAETRRGALDDRAPRLRGRRSTPCASTALCSCCAPPRATRR